MKDLQEYALAILFRLRILEIFSRFLTKRQLQLALPIHPQGRGTGQVS